MAAKEIIHACELGDIAEVRRLLPQVRNPADVKSNWWPGRALLHYSCRHGWLDVTRKLVEQYHCDPKSRDECGDTPLHIACSEGHVNIVRYLVSERVCSTCYQNKDGNTPLIEACRNGTHRLLQTDTCDSADDRVVPHYLWGWCWSVLCSDVWDCQEK